MELTPCVIEARINEYVSSTENSNIPYTIDEIVRSAVRVQEAGATVLHMHARTASGDADNSVETNARLIKAIRENTDLYIHSTLGFFTNDDTPADRIENVRRLCQDLKCGPDIVPIDVGSCNLEVYDHDEKTVTSINLYENRTDSILQMAEEFSKLDVNIQFFCWAPSFVRRGAMLTELGLIKHQPHYVFHLTGGKKITCNPPTKLGLESMLEVLPANTPWGIAVGGTSMFDTILPYALERGGNVSIGLGDYIYPELGCPSNETLVTMVKCEIEKSGRRAATREETRQLLGLI